jgi:hypothetical protein
MMYSQAAELDLRKSSLGGWTRRRFSKSYNGSCN